MSHLTTLVLDGTRVSNDGLAHLESLSRLQRLYLRDTAVTIAGVESLSRALPSCEILMETEPQK